MASKREIVAELRAQYGNMLSQNQIRQFLGRGTHQTMDFTSDLPYMQTGRAKKYFAIDVARKLYELQVNKQ